MVINIVYYNKFIKCRNTKCIYCKNNNKECMLGKADINESGKCNLIKYQ